MASQDPMTKWSTIAPINPFYRDAESQFNSDVDMGYDVRICKTPEWADQPSVTDHLTFNQKTDLTDGEYAFISDYEAEALGSPDPTWKGKKARGIQDVRLERIRLCNLAIWIAKPTSLNFNFYIHTQNSGGEWIMRQTGPVPAIAPRDEEEHDSLNSNDIQVARDLFGAIIKIPRQGTLWITIKTLLNALGSTTWWEVRYFLLWICLEALFGSDSEISHQLSERIALFLNRTSGEKKQAYKDAKVAYKWRSKIVHGRQFDSLAPETASTIMRNTENFLRPALQKILLENDLIHKFSNENLRNEYLRDLIF